jgi:transcriptional regulator CtsR
MHTLGAIGDAVDEKTCRSHLVNLVYMDLLTKRDAALMSAAVSDRTLETVDPSKRDAVRAAIFKSMLLTVLQDQ